MRHRRAAQRKKHFQADDSRTDYNVYEGDALALAYKHCSVYGGCPADALRLGRPIFIHLSPAPLDVYCGSTLNYSRTDYPYLVIETEQCCGADGIPIEIVGLCMQGVRICNGMQGLVFSK